MQESKKGAEAVKSFNCLRPLNQLMPGVARRFTRLTRVTTPVTGLQCLRARFCRLVRKARGPVRGSRETWPQGGTTPTARLGGLRARPGGSRARFCRLVRKAPRVAGGVQEPCALRRSVRADGRGAQTGIGAGFHRRTAKAHADSGFLASLQGSPRPRKTGQDPPCARCNAAEPSRPRLERCIEMAWRSVG